jgi:serine/threonine-protein kinase
VTLRIAGVVRVREAGMTAPPSGPARPYFVMDLLPGETLESLLGAGRTSRGDLLRILEETARILAAASDAGVLHGGLKPSNIFVERGARVLVSDFGVSRRPWTGAGGDPDALPRQRYRAPEQLRPTLPPGAAADVFALGAILYEILTGRPTFPAAEPEPLFESIIEARFEPVRRWSPTVEPAIESVCMKALQKEPLRRYPDAAAFAGDLERFRLGKPVIAEPWSPPRKPQGQRAR